MKTRAPRSDGLATREAILAAAEAEDVRAWMEAHADDSSGFSAMGDAFGGLKV